MYIVTREINEGQFHISLECEGGGYILVSASAWRSFMVAWIKKVKDNGHPQLWWSDKHEKAFPKEKAERRYRDDHEFYGRTDSLDQALSLIDTMMLLDDEARDKWEN